MRFADPGRDAALTEWRAHPDRRDRAEADNIWFEEQVSEPRRHRFEALAPAAPSPAALRAWHVDYWKTYIQTSDPDTFRRDLRPTRPGPWPLDADQRIVRLESVRPDVLNEAGMTLADLLAAHSGHDTAVLDLFLQRWNVKRDGRPAFAAWKDEMLDELRAPDWPDRFRDRLGLAHYDPSSARPIPVILMEYDVSTVLRAAAGRDTICIPTVLDSGPSPWFFPSPAGLAYGRSMDISEHDPQLRSELLHVPVAYAHDHIARIGEIAAPVTAPPMQQLRNRHLAALRTAARNPAFGQEMA